MYRVTGNLKHDGKVYAEGEYLEFDLPETQAKPLIEAGVIELVEEEEGKKAEEDNTQPESTPTAEPEKPAAEEKPKAKQSKAKPSKKEEEDLGDDL